MGRDGDDDPTDRTGRTSEPEPRRRDRWPEFTGPRRDTDRTPSEPDETGGPADVNATSPDGASDDALEGASVDDPDPPQVLERLGQIGIYLSVAAVALAVVGLGAGSARVQPFANIALVLALGLGSVAMVFGAIYQASVSGLAP